MNVGVYLTGAFGQSNGLYHARNEAKRGRGSQEAVVEQALQDTRTIIQRQKEVGCSYIIDPSFNTYYLFQPFAENVPGMEVGPQENWFNNNVFYWRPRINGPLSTPEPGFSSKSLYLSELPMGRTAMAILPSPYTLLMLSDVYGYPNKRAAMVDLGQLLAAEARDLANQGFGRIQYDEPALVVQQSLGSLTREDLSLLAAGMEHCGQIDGASTSLHTYFGDAEPILDRLADLPVDCLGIDATETSLDALRGRKFLTKELALGLVDARNPSLEDLTELHHTLTDIASACQPKALWLTPNTGTEYVGWTLGLEKMKVLEAVKGMFNGH